MKLMCQQTFRKAASPEYSSIFRKAKLLYLQSFGGLLREAETTQHSQLKNRAKCSDCFLKPLSQLDWQIIVFRHQAALVADRPAKAKVNCCLPGCSAHLLRYLAGVCCVSSVLEEPRHT